MPDQQQQLHVLQPFESLSYSRRSTFRRCRRLYYYRYIERLEDKITPAPLRMGSVYSDALEAADPEVASLKYSDLIAEAIHEGQYYLSEQMLDELAVVKPMAHTYLEHVAQEGVLREVEFRGHQRNGYEDNGRMDGVLRNGDNIVIVENKLKARWGRAEEAALATDDQLTSYILNACHSFDVEPDKITARYEVAKKPALRQHKNETREAFRARITADILSRPQHYHTVIEGITRSQNQLDQWLRDFERMTLDLVNEARHDEQHRWPTNPDACYQYGACPFLAVCGARSGQEAAEIAAQKFQRREEDNGVPTTS